MRLGIDFGTTQTVVALCDRGNYPVVHFEGPDGSLSDGYPTAVAIRGQERRYGAEALACFGQPGWSVHRSFKRLLAERAVASNQPVRLGEVETTMLELVTGFLEALMRDLRQRSTVPDSLLDGPVEAVVAVPANSHSAQRFITLEAFRQAGFEVRAMLNEPSAGALEYAHRYQRSFSSRRQDVVVYDLGGGTFDASLVDMSASDHVVQASRGLARLGGDDLDHALMALTLQRAGLPEEALTEQERARLLQHCRQQKETLNPNSRLIHVELGVCLDESTARARNVEPTAIVSLEVEDYYAACRPLIDMTLTTLAEIQGLPEGELLASVAGLYVVGGASALPAVTRVLREVFGHRVRRAPYASAATAIGLAIAADHPEIAVSERLSRHFGVFREWAGGAEVSFDVIFDDRTRVPGAADKVEVVRTYRPRHNLGHFRYAECSHIDAGGIPSGDVTPSAEVRFPFDPALRAPDVDLTAIEVVRTDHDGPLIEERYTVDAAGIVEITFTDLEAGHRRSWRMGAGER